MERILDAAHALMSHGVDRYPRKRAPDLHSEQRRERERQIHQERMYNDLWRTVPTSKGAKKDTSDDERRRALLQLPQENILYFLEKVAPRLKPWQREVLRIVRQIAQYFYPHGQTKLMNEGCATYCHYYIMHRLHERGLISDGALLECLHAHTNVVFQPDYDDPRYTGLNPYALGFAIMQDIERICTRPTEEDQAWFPDIAGAGDPFSVLREVWANYRDESFILQFLSPKVIRDFRLFHIRDDAAAPELVVDAIHNERGYQGIRRALARQYDIAWTQPDIQVVDVDLAGDRRLILHHRVVNGGVLEQRNALWVLEHLADLWGYDVVLREIDSQSEALLKEQVVSPKRPM